MNKNYTFYVQGPASYDYIKMMEKAGYLLTDSREEAGIILFTGGSDVSPELYGEQTLSTTGVDKGRDLRDITCFNETKGKFRVGVCRGGQFLNVMCGGKLWQDVDNHCRDHSVYSLVNEESFLASSTHHQMMRPAAKAEILWVAKEATLKENWDGLYTVKEDSDADVEACWYADEQCLCVQPHPEFSETRYTALTDSFIELIQRYYKG